MTPIFRALPAALLCALTLTACGVQKPAETSRQSKPITQQQQQQMQQMEPQFLYLAAQNALKDGNRALAAEFLTALVAKDPQAVEPHIQLAELLLQLGRGDDAEQQIALLLKKPVAKGDQEKLLLTQARLKVSKDEMDHALQLLQELFSINPVNLPGRNLQAQILSTQGRIDDALAAIGDAIRSEERPEFLLLQAQLLIKKKEYKTAEISLMRMRRLAPDSDMAVLILSSIALLENNPSKAETVLREFLSSYPDALRVGHALGKILVQEERIAEAIIVYRDLSNRSGENPDILKTLGMLYFRYKDFEKSEQIFRKLYQERADDYSRFYLAASLETLKRTEEARQLYESIDPKSAMAADAEVRLAGLDFADDNLQLALKRLQHVLKASPDHTEAHLIRSAIRLTEKRYTLLIEESEATQAKTKVHPQLLFNRAVAFEHLKDYAQMESMLKRVLSIEPKHADAMNFLGYSYADRGIKLQRAEQLILQALQLKPDDGYYLDSLAWTYFQRGQYKEALKNQQKAVSIINDDPIMFDHLGDILWQSGKAQAAREAWQKSIDLNVENPDAVRLKITNGLEIRP